MQLKTKASGVLVAPAVRDLDRLAATLTDWLSRRMPEARDLAISNLDYPRGAGQSHETILFDCSWREGGQSRQAGLVVRIKPTSHTVFQDDMFVEQYEVMKRLHDARIAPIAEPLWYEADPAVLGSPFFVMRKLVGRVAVSIPSYMSVGWVVDSTPAERARLWENGVRTLAALQRTPLEMVDFLARPQDGATGFDQEWGRWRRFLDWVSQNRALPLHERAYELLAATAPANRAEGLVWGDARLGNMMADQDCNIIAVMDWEQPSIGGALHDLGWWLSHEGAQVASRPDKQRLPGFGSRDETIALWGEVTGISTTDIDWYEAYATFKMACLSVRLTGLRGLPLSPADIEAMPPVRRLVEMLGLA